MYSSTQWCAETGPVGVCSVDVSNAGRPSQQDVLWNKCESQYITGMRNVCQWLTHNFLSFQIRFQSFTAPLLLLGCFCQECQSFQPSLTDDIIFSSPGFQTFEAEFKTWQQPGERLDENSFVFSAAEVFRFLRDMAQDISMTQSTSLLQVQSWPFCVYTSIGETTPTQPHTCIQSSSCQLFCIQNGPPYTCTCIYVHEHGHTCTWHTNYIRSMREGEKDNRDKQVYDMILTRQTRWIHI